MKIKENRNSLNKKLEAPPKEAYEIVGSVGRPFPTLSFNFKVKLSFYSRGDFHIGSAVHTDRQTETDPVTL